MNKVEFEALFTGPQRWQQVGLYFLSRFAITWAGKLLFSIVVIIAFAISGCANGPLSSCDEVVIEHHRKGGKISGKATWDDCRPIQPSLPALL